MPPLDQFAELVSKRGCAVSEFAVRLSYKVLMSSILHQVKALLLDQSFAAGVGNWIADEVLFQARVHPSVRARTLPDDAVKALHTSLQYVLYPAGPPAIVLRPAPSQAPFPVRASLHRWCSWPSTQMQTAASSPNRGCFTTAGRRARRPARRLLRLLQVATRLKLPPRSASECSRRRCLMLGLVASST